MKTHMIIALAVADYTNVGETDPFTAAADAYEEAGQAAIAQLERAGLKNLEDFTVTETNFIEFDRRDVAKACAMWEVDLSGITQERLDAHIFGA